MLHRVFMAMATLVDLDTLQNLTPQVSVEWISAGSIHGWMMALDGHAKTTDTHTCTSSV